MFKNLNNYRFFRYCFRFRAKTIRFAQRWIFSRKTRIESGNFKSGRYWTRTSMLCFEGVICFPLEWSRFQYYALVEKYNENKFKTLILSVEMIDWSDSHRSVLNISNMLRSIIIIVPNFFLYYHWFLVENVNNEYQLFLFNTILHGQKWKTRGTKIISTYCISTYITAIQSILSVLLKFDFQPTICLTINKAFDWNM